MSSGKQFYFANPYSPGTQLHSYLEVLKDLEWHCAACELSGSQPAKPLQMMRLDGWQFEGTQTRWDSKRFCQNCERKTSHRRLKTLERLEAARDRAVMPARVRERVLKMYDGRDAILGHKPSGRSVEVDHRIPQVRWTEDERIIQDSITDGELRDRFMLLARENNLLKSRYCERCDKTGFRQPFLGVDFFYRGGPKYEPEHGCVGCGWHNPDAWRDHLNQLVRAPAARDK